MDYRHYIIYDYETVAKNPHSCEICQIGAVAVNRYNLKIKDEFVCDCKPEDFDAVEPGALKVNKFTMERLEAAPEMKVVWPSFVAFVRRHCMGKGDNSFTYPIGGGYGIRRFDSIITSRYCQQYGQWDAKREEANLFNPAFAIDVQDEMWMWFHNNPEIKNIKLPTILEYMGVDKKVLENAHDALFDAKWTARIAIRLLNACRSLTDLNETTGRRRMEMKDCFKNG